MPKSFHGATKVILKCPHCAAEAPKKKMKLHLAKVHDIVVTSADIHVRKDN